MVSGTRADRGAARAHRRSVHVSAPGSMRTEWSVCPRRIDADGVSQRVAKRIIAQPTGGNVAVTVPPSSQRYDETKLPPG